MKPATAEQRRRARRLRARFPDPHRATIAERAAEIRATGKTREQTAQTIAAAIDALIPLDAFGLIGAVGEVFDGIVIYLVVVLIITEVERAANPRT